MSQAYSGGKFMKAIPAALLAFAALAACSSDYVLSTRTGGIIETTNKPYLDERTGMYNYRTKDGKDAAIRKEEVVEILER
jgi:Bacterial protein of unknown function (DUF903)